MTQKKEEQVPVEVLAKRWLEQDQDPETRATIKGLLEVEHTEELEKRLRVRMAFGTAGLRAAMDAGNAFMNSLTILQTSQGLAKYVLSQNRNSEKKKKVGMVIGFDGRRNSAKFAALAANVFTKAGIKVYMFRDVVPTPYVPFAVLKYEVAAGVMVTASHNPKNDNGYKVYWSTGAQIVAPHDTGIAVSIEQNLEVDPAQWHIDNIASKCIDPTADVEKDFFASMKSSFLLSSSSSSPSSATSSASSSSSENNNNNNAVDVPIVYTAMHGVGSYCTLKAVKEVAGMKQVFPVKEQCFPDSYFRTVEFPNPEEGKSSLNLSMEVADKCGANIIIANDPDADRLAVAERVSGKSWKIFTGNELGALLGWYCVKRAQAAGIIKKNSNKTLEEKKQGALLSSTVSSMILRSIASHEGLYFEETLTGFKFMGTRTQELEEEAEGEEKAPYRVLFAFEEAIGFMCGSRIRDKDGVTAAAVLCDMVRRFHTSSWTLSKQLDEIYAEYGLHVSFNSYVISRDPKKTEAMFEQWRNGGKYLDQIGGSKVLNVRDLVTGYDSSRSNKKAVLPLSTASPMITAELENGVRFTVRASGTEPKVKFYTEIIAKKGVGKEECQKVLDQSVAAIMKEIIQPEKFGFTLRASS